MTFPIFSAKKLLKHQTAYYSLYSASGTIAGLDTENLLQEP